MEVAKAASRWRASRAQRPADDLPEHRRAGLHRAAAGAGSRRARHPRRHTQYTQATGLPALRERISGWYAERFGVDVPARRIVVTAGASAALQLACLALIEAGDEILMPDPSYPVQPAFRQRRRRRRCWCPTTAPSASSSPAAKVGRHWARKTRGVLLASPSNPTGTSIAPDELRASTTSCARRGGITLIDEIYLGPELRRAPSATRRWPSTTSVISINSFSKYFNMTGWRLGWMVVPEALVPVIERSRRTCSSAQHGGAACGAGLLRAREHRRIRAPPRRVQGAPRLVHPAAEAPGPHGAGDARRRVLRLGRLQRRGQRLGVSGSWDFAFELMKRAHVAVTPGRDFGTPTPAGSSAFPPPTPWRTCRKRRPG
jgi:aspartate/methionine/tyrosine aminotransferase